MNNKLLNKLFCIGFEYTNDSIIKLGISEIYSYYPEHFKNARHYDLVLFRYNNQLEPIEYRLYIHNDLDGSYVNSPFQSFDISYIDDLLNIIFNKELLQYQRINKLKRIIEQ